MKYLAESSEEENERLFKEVADELFKESRKDKSKNHPQFKSFAQLVAYVDSEAKKEVEQIVKKIKEMENNGELAKRMREMKTKEELKEKEEATRTEPKEITTMLLQQITKRLDEMERRIVTLENKK